MPVFDAFADDGHVQRMSHRDHGGDDLLVTMAPGDVLDEAAVDFQRVGGELLQVTECGITGPEVIERDADPGSRQQRQRFLYVADMLEEGGLGNLQAQLGRAQAIPPERSGDSLAQTGAG